QGLGEPSSCSNIGGDDGNRTRVRGFADRSLDHSGTSPRQLALAAPRGFEPRFTDPKSAVLPLDDGAANPPHEASRSGARKWSGRRDSNPRPSPWQGDALPTEPLPPVPMRAAMLVPRVRIELTTPASSGRCSTN